MRARRLELAQARGRATDVLASSPATAARYVSILDGLEAAGIRYAVLHDPSATSDASGGDLDLVVAADHLAALDQHLRVAYRVVQVFRYEARSWGYVLAVELDGGPTWVVLDVSLDYRWRGRVFFSGEELLEGRVWRDGVWATAPRRELSYLLVKKIYEKGVLPAHQQVRLRRLIVELGDEAQSCLHRLFGQSHGSQLLGWIQVGDWGKVQQATTQLQNALRRQVLRRQPLNAFRYWIAELRRVWSRWRHPTGLLVAVLGPDGAGKSTLIQALQKQLMGPFRRTAVLHLRPHFGVRAVGPGPTRPHDKPARPTAVAMAKLLYYWIDYELGYWLRVRPLLARSTLVLFDRYYPDVLVDPRRYRYGGPMGFARLIAKLVPRADVILVLDAPERELLARKQELDLKEAQRLRQAYRHQAARLREAELLDASQPRDVVTRHAADTIVAYLQHRCSGAQVVAGPALMA